MPARRAQSDSTATEVSRRRALKLAAGVGAGTIVWSEPTIKGLARTPAYANAASAVDSPFTVTTPGEVAITVGGAAVTVMSTGGFMVSMTLVDLGDMFGTYQLTAVNADNACPCTITSATLTLTDPGPAPPLVVGGSAGGGAVTFAGLIGTNLTISGSFSGTCPA